MAKGPKGLVNSLAGQTIGGALALQREEAN